jgi:hypothetical protein
VSVPYYNYAFRACNKQYFRSGFQPCRARQTQKFLEYEYVEEQTLFLPFMSGTIEVSLSNKTNAFSVEFGVNSFVRACIPFTIRVFVLTVFIAVTTKASISAKNANC